MFISDFLQLGNKIHFNDRQNIKTHSFIVDFGLRQCPLYGGRSAAEVLCTAVSPLIGLAPLNDRF